MNYVLLIYETAEGFAMRKDPERAAAYMGGWLAYSKAMTDAGVMVGGAGLQPPDMATTITFETGKHHVQDGPYAETKEQLGGFFLIDVPDLDVALDWAARCPAVPGTQVEVRATLQRPS